MGQSMPPAPQRRPAEVPAFGIGPTLRALPASRGIAWLRSTIAARIITIALLLHHNPFRRTFRLEASERPHKSGYKDARSKRYFPVVLWDVLGCAMCPYGGHGAPGVAGEETLLSADRRA